MSGRRGTRLGERALIAGLAAAMALSLAGCAAQVPPPTPSMVASETTVISIFYPDGEILVEERHVVPVSDNMPEVALRRLFEASPEQFEIAVVLPEATVNSVRVDEDTGVCTVDFSADVLDFPGDEREAQLVAFAAIIETLRQFPEVRQLVVTVDGLSSGTLDGRQVEEFWGEVRLPSEPLDVAEY